MCAVTCESVWGLSSTGLGARTCDVLVPDSEACPHLLFSLSVRLDAFFLICLLCLTDLSEARVGCQSRMAGELPLLDTLLLHGARGWGS